MLRNLGCALLLLVVLAGCSNPEKSLVGTWKGTATSKPKPGDLSASLQNAMVASMTIEFHADKTFKMVMILPVEGTWDYSAGKVTLTVTKAMGMDITKDQQAKGNKPLVLDLSSDGKTLRTEGASGGMGTMTFTKQETS